MRKPLQESLPAMIPEYPVEIAGHHLILRFDVNINKTKKGVKLQFVMKDVPQDPRKLQLMANEIGTELQERFGEANMQIVYDVENPYKNVIGFLLPLPSIANNIITNVLKGGASEEGTDSTEEEEPVADSLPAQEQPPSEDDDIMKEIMMRYAGIKAVNMTDQ